MTDDPLGDILAALSASPFVHEPKVEIDYHMVFRYDNAPHFPNLPTAPHHKHIGENEVISADAPDLQSVLREIESMIQA